ncbi:MAG: hypothetical protein WEF51_01940 [Chloroflexota bacterium]
MNRQEIQDRPLHGRALELAAAAIDFDLTSAEADELAMHVATCQTCARRAAALRADASTLRRPLTLLPSPRVDAAVQGAIARRRARPRRVLLLAAATLFLVALLGVMAVGAYLLRGWMILPTTVVPTPTAPLTAASPAPDASPVAVGVTWRPFAVPAGDIGKGWLGLMKAVTRTESGFVAVGGPECTPEGQPTECHGAMWTTVVGASWTRLPDQPGLDLSPDAPNQRPPTGIFDVAYGPAGLVAIGYPYDGRGPGIWHSTDGQTWERVQVDFGSSALEMSTYRLAAVAAGPGGYVIGGYVVDSTVPNDAATYPARAAAWTSPDGVTWTRAADNADMDVGLCIDTGEDPGCGGMRAVAATANGFVAVGHRRTAADAIVPAAWTSPDGLTWVRSDAGLDFAGTLLAVAVGAPGIVATGSGFDALSRDGVSWTFVPASGPPSNDSRLASDGGVVLGVGWNNVNATFQAWRTTDGLTREAIETVSIPSDVLGVGSADIAVLGDQAVIVLWAIMDSPRDGDGAAPALPDISLSFQSP